MLYIKYSELTERYYLVPKSKKESKVDITDDIKEIVEFEKSKSPSPSEAGDAVEFAEWIRDEDYVQSNRNGDKWYQKPFKEDSKFYTTSELYHQFKKTVK